MKIKTLYIDDEEIDLTRNKDYFNADDRFELIPCKPSDLAEAYKCISTVIPELILVDLDLSSADGEGKVIDLNGLTLMTEIRQKFQKIPLILFTKRSIFESEISSVPENLLYTIDHVVYKEQVSKHDPTLLDELYSLAEGYHKLSLIDKLNWDTIYDLLEASEEDYDSIKASSPPSLLTTGSPYLTIEVSKWIRKTLFEYPGILYDSLHAATFLGISETEFLSDIIQEYFLEAKYSGLFSIPSVKNYWWKSKLSEIANENMNDDEAMMPLRKAFFINWKRIKGAELEIAKCVYSEESPAEWVCYVLKKPMMLKYSLLYHPDSRPEIMDEARVSFKAIITSNDVNDDMIDSMSKDILKDIRDSGKKSRAN
jgi:CheY-like chemotaxis protein